MAAVTICSDFGAPKIKPVTVAHHIRSTGDISSEIPQGMKCKEVWSHGVLGLGLAPLLDLENVI